MIIVRKLSLGGWKGTLTDFADSPINPSETPRGELGYSLEPRAPMLEMLACTN